MLVAHLVGVMDPNRLPLFFTLVFKFQLLLSYRLHRLCSLGFPFILRCYSKILIFDQFMDRLLSNFERRPKYGHMVFGS